MGIRRRLLTVALAAWLSGLSMAANASKPLSPEALEQGLTGTCAALIANGKTVPDFWRDVAKLGATSATGTEFVSSIRANLAAQQFDLTEELKRFHSTPAQPTGLPFETVGSRLRAPAEEASVGLYFQQLYFLQGGDLEEALAEVVPILIARAPLLAWSLLADQIEAQPTSYDRLREPETGTVIRIGGENGIRIELPAPRVPRVVKMRTFVVIVVGTLVAGALLAMHLLPKGHLVPVEVHPDNSTPAPAPVPGTGLVPHGN